MGWARDAGHRLAGVALVLDDALNRWGMGWPRAGNGLAGARMGQGQESWAGDTPDVGPV